MDNIIHFSGFNSDSYIDYQYLIDILNPITEDGLDFKIWMGNVFYYSENNFTDKNYVGTSNKCIEIQSAGFNYDMFKINDIIDVIKQICHFLFHEYGLVLTKKSYYQCGESGKIFFDFSKEYLDTQCILIALYFDKTPGC